MKIIYKINKWSYIITLALYLTLFLGMYAQIALGAIQIILALIISVKWKKLDTNSKTKMLNYLVVILMYGFLLLVIDFENIAGLLIILLFVLPMLIATYFVYITYKIYNQLK